MKNGGCDANAICSHVPKTNEIKCTCKSGYTNTGSAFAVCSGESLNESTEETRKQRYLLFTIFQDSCKIDNGGCDENAVCSHDARTNAVKCTCKTGYMNTGCSSNVICTGEEFNETPCTIRERKRYTPMPFQMVVKWTKVGVMETQCVRMIQKQTQLYVLASLATQIPALVQVPCVKVKGIIRA